jgi:hypothetical protein
MRPPGLGQDAGDSADREREADALFVPLVASEVDREERPDCTGTNSTCSA